MAGAPLDLGEARPAEAPARRGAGGTETRGRNVGNVERVASGLLGGALVLAGLSGARRRSWGGAALALVGGELLRRGATGHCEVYDALGVSTADEAGDAGLNTAGRLAGAPGARATAEARITVGGGPEAVYRAFRDPANVARLLGDAASVRVVEPAVEHWTVRGPWGRDVAFDAEYTEDRPGEAIAWRTLPGALVPHEGVVRFSPAPGDWGTEVRLLVRYDPPGGAVGELLADAFDAVPNTLALRALRRFKSLVETGELPTLAHNPSARGDARGGRAGGTDAAGYSPDGPHLPLSDHTT